MIELYVFGGFGGAFVASWYALKRTYNEVLKKQIRGLNWKRFDKESLMSAYKVIIGEVAEEVWSVRRRTRKIIRTMDNEAPPHLQFSKSELENILHSTEVSNV